MEPVKLKGNREGLILKLDLKTSFPILCENIMAKIKSADAFLGDNREIIINTGNHVLDSDQIEELTRVLQSLDLGIKKIISEAKEEREVEKPINSQQKIELEQSLSEGSTLMVRKNLRSGQSVFHEGTVIVMGDINPGAEVVAGGHIFVLGHLRGVAHAGARGDKDAVVYANKLQPTQLRIANLITRAPDDESVAPNEPELARIKDGMVIIEKYSLYKEE
ncbi:MAG: septum site-determining protein MinC [Clostridia bacterium]|jgi:septum site-determining protein MinC|nr:septum site-determining protein MinC [Clostridia bacterium]